MKSDWVFDCTNRVQSTGEAGCPLQVGLGRKSNGLIYDF
jgi:hypothetical protein